MGKICMEREKYTENKKGYIWNSVAGLINAGEAVILLMVITRTNGIEDAGIITIAFTVGNLMMTIGKFGVRNYQVTDVNDLFSFSTYFNARICTVICMFLASTGYLAGCFWRKDYSIYKIIVILLICGIYMIESLEDVFCGLYQKNGRLDLGGMVFTCRWLCHLAVITMVLAFTRNLILALVLGIFVGGICSYMLNRFYMKKFTYAGYGFSIQGIWSLTKNCFPLFLVAFMSNYVTNAPKYAIDTYMSEEVQACYGFIAMPVFVISLLNSFLYQPILVHLALEWKEKQLDLLKRQIFRQLLIILGLTLICLLGGWLLGIPVLSILYNTELGAYKTELMVLLFGGGLLAVVGFLCVVMTIMRLQRKMMYGYIITALFALLLSGRFIVKGGIMGAALLYVMLMAILTIIFSVIVIKNLKSS